MDYNAYWAALPTGGWRRLLMDQIITCRMLGIVGSVAEPRVMVQKGGKGRGYKVEKDEGKGGKV